MINLVYDSKEYNNKGKPTKIIFLNHGIFHITFYQSILHVVDFCYNKTNSFNKETCDGRLYK